MGPNQDRITDQMVSRLSVWPQVSFIKTGSYKGIGQRLIGFRVFVSVVIRQCYRPRLIKLVKYGSYYYFFKDYALDKDGVV